IESVFGDAPPDVDQLPQLPFLHWVIKESMRILAVYRVRSAAAIEGGTIRGCHRRRGSSPATISPIVYQICIQSRNVGATSIQRSMNICRSTPALESASAALRRSSPEDFAGDDFAALPI